MGGGVQFDLIHEIDYLNYLFGEPLALEKQYRRVSHLEIDSCDYAHYSATYQKFSANVTLNYFRRDAKRTLEIVRENDTLLLNFIEGNIINLMTGQTLLNIDKEGLPLSYLNQMKYFLSAAKSKKHPMNSLEGIAAYNQTDLMILKGKNIIVTGSEGLLGKAIVTDIQKEGGIAICLDISHETAPELHRYKVDLTHQEETENILIKLFEAYHHIDGLVNNAYPRTKDWGTKMEEVALSSFRQNVDWQLNSVFHLIQLISNHMIEFNQGSVVNIASIYGIVGTILHYMTIQI